MKSLTKALSFGSNAPSRGSMLRIFYANALCEVIAAMLACSMTLELLAKGSHVTVLGRRSELSLQLCKLHCTYWVSETLGMQLLVACGSETVVVQAGQGDTFGDVLDRVRRRRPWLLSDDAAVSPADFMFFHV